MMKICFSCPTVLLRRPIAEILSHIPNKKSGLLVPKDLIKGIIKVHYNKFKNKEIIFYTTINPPTSSEWPIPLNPFLIIRLINIFRKYDVIHMWVPFYITNVLILIIKKLFFQRKKIYLTMDTFPGLSFKMGKFYDFAFKIFYKSLGRFLFSGVNKLILYTHSLRRYAHYLNFENHKINVIPPGIETNIKEKKKDIRKEFRIDNDQRIILFVGILNKRKGVEKIIHIAKKFNKNDIKFIIVGDGAEKKNLMKKIEEYKLNQIIHLTGFRKDVHNFYQEADILLFPSNGEGLPGVLMEGMLYGVPIVANDIFGVRFLIKNKYNGLLCKTDSIEEYYEKISYLLNNKKLRIKFIKRSKKIIQNQFTWNKQIEKYKKLY